MARARKVVAASLIPCDQSKRPRISAARGPTSTAEAYTVAGGGIGQIPACATLLTGEAAASFLSFKHVRTGVAC